MTLTIAVLGCGSIGRRHLQNVRMLGYTGMIAYDPEPEALEQIGAEQGVLAVDDLQLVWARQPSVVLVCAPSNLHLPLAQEAVQHGCHVFIEKPLSHSLDGVKELESEIQRRGLTSMVGCNMRFHPGPAQVKQWLGDGVLGTILSGRIQTGSYLPRWRPWQDYRQSYSASSEWGGAVLDCIHEIDLALWLLGSAKVAASVTRPAKSLGLATDGLAEIILEHESGVISNVHLNFVQRNYHKSIQIVGSEGTIEWEFNSGRTNLYGPDGCSVEQIDQPDGWYLNQMYVDELRYFLDCVEEKTPTFNPVKQASKTLEVALQARAGSCKES